MRSRLAAVALLAALPALATIWTRSTSLIKVPRGGAKEALQHAVYTTREWSVEVVDAVTEEEAPSGQQLGVKWIFEYRNSDAVPHHVSVTVQYQDAFKASRGQFGAKVTLAPTGKDTGRFEVPTKCRTDDWHWAVLARVTIDFLSTPNG
jgi:hypothetical protein